ncbi:MAG: FtsX-like permease family protein, partial [Bacteroidota bacterium]
FLESLMVVFVSLILGIILAEFLVPAYNKLGPWIDLKITYLGNILLWLFLITLMIIVAVLGGLYPALYVSRFSTQQIFKQRIKLRGSNLFTRSLLIVQLVFSTIALVQGVLYVQNSQLQNEYPLGFNKHGIITVPLSNSSGIESFANDLKQNNSIQGVALASHHIGHEMSFAEVSHDGNETAIRWFEVGDNYFEIMDMALIEGRFFSNFYKADALSSLIVNEEFANTFVLQIHDEIVIDSMRYTIIGIVNDFYPFGLWRGEQSKPAAFKLTHNAYNYLLVDAGDGDNKSKVNTFLKEEWPKHFPDAPYEAEFDNKQVYLSELLSNNMSYLSFFQAIVAIFLAVNALFTMVSISIMNRRKEVGVRKVMGANILQILGLFGRGVFVTLSIALIGGILAGNYMSELFLDLMFSVHSHLSWQTVVITCLIIFSTTYCTISFKVIEAAKNSPVDSLRYE